MKPLVFTLTNDSVTVMWKGKPISVRRGATNYNALRDAVAKAFIADTPTAWDEVPKHLTVQKSIREWAQGKFTLNAAGNQFSFQERLLPGDINARIIQMATNNEDPTPFFKFYERLQQNPSMRSVEQCVTFLKHGGIPLDENGFILAYKSVTSGYRDHHSGQFDNTPGTVNEMPRNQISDDPNQSCDPGFHVGALGYAGTFGGGSSIIVICRIDPADVVSIPYDSASQKMRVCKYEVIGHHNGELMPNTVFVEDKHEEEEEYDADEENFNQPGNEDREEEEFDESDGTHIPEEARVRPPKKPSTKRPSTKGFDKLNLKQLMDKSIGDLRQYAGKHLKITGASKIPGGKTALVSKILKIRKKG